MEGTQIHQWYWSSLAAFVIFQQLTGTIFALITCLLSSVQDSNELVEKYC